MSKKNPSRRERFDEIKALCADLSSQAQELRDELQNWLDNMPENLQGGEKAQQLDDAISGLEDFIGNVDDAASTEIEFPSMR